MSERMPSQDLQPAAATVENDSKQQQQTAAVCGSDNPRKVELKEHQEQQQHQQQQQQNTHVVQHTVRPALTEQAKVAEILKMQHIVSNAAAFVHRLRTLDYNQQTRTLQLGFAPFDMTLHELLEVGRREARAQLQQKQTRSTTRDSNNGPDTINNSNNNNNNNNNNSGVTAGVTTRMSPYFIPLTGHLRPEQVSQVAHAVAHAIRSMHRANVSHLSLSTDEVYLTFAATTTRTTRRMCATLNALSFNMAPIRTTDLAVSAGGKVAGAASAQGSPDSTSKNAPSPVMEYVCSRNYRPPEVILKCGKLPDKADVWSFGCILYELATCEPLFSLCTSRDGGVTQVKLVKQQVTEILNTVGGPESAESIAQLSAAPPVAKFLEQFVGKGNDLLVQTLKKKVNVCGSNDLASSSSSSSASAWSEDRLAQFVEVLSTCLRFDPASRPTFDAICRLPFFLCQGDAKRDDAVGNDDGDEASSIYIPNAQLDPSVDPVYKFVQQWKQQHQSPDAETCNIP